MRYHGPMACSSAAAGAGPLCRPPHRPLRLADGVVISIRDCSACTNDAPGIPIMLGSFIGSPGKSRKLPPPSPLLALSKTTYPNATLRNAGVRSTILVTRCPVSTGHDGVRPAQGGGTD